MKEAFERDLSASLLELCSRSEKDTVQISVFGGAYIVKDKYAHSKEYVDSVKLISDITAKAVGFEPEVIVGPKRSTVTDDRWSLYDNVIYDNAEKRLYFIRTRIEDSSKGFKLKDIDGESKKWK